jgi:hypothetical protein
MQWFGKHVSTIETLFSAWSVPKSYLENNCRYKTERGEMDEKGTQCLGV